MKTKTIRNIHSILSGAFATAKRWDWIDWNPTESANLDYGMRTVVTSCPMGLCA